MLWSFIGFRKLVLSTKGKLNAISRARGECGILIYFRKGAKCEYPRNKISYCEYIQYPYVSRTTYVYLRDTVELPTYSLVAYMFTYSYVLTVSLCTVLTDCLYEHKMYTQKQ